ncbi:MAG: hypothetical protein F9K22_08900 [Bacteroidetes bacterium]|nr:MAG: hypothetical protein F9K22_08900 [Bacteroidota bacterium]
MFKVIVLGTLLSAVLVSAMLILPAETLPLSVLTMLLLLRGLEREKEGFRKGAERKVVRL